MSLTTLPLDSLILSKLNVRHTERDADIAALADDIAARGLKQNLVVIPAHFTTGEAKEGWQDKWEVIAGGRRFQAMQLLVADGRLPADHPVACLLEDRTEASETSLSENLHKVAMNPADEFAAFAKIVDNCLQRGESRDEAIAWTAKRFGATVKHVEGRMRLASLCPEVLDALRANVIGIDAAKAYATTADHDLQRKVFAQVEKDSWRSHDPKAIRSEIRGKTLPLDAPLVQFVGLVTYQAEGGRIEAEMFMGAQEQQRVVDVPLLEKLAAKIADEAIPPLVKVEGLKSGLLAKGVGHGASWPKAPAGFERAWDYGEAPSKAKLKKSIGIYAINPDGTGLMRVGRFKPVEAREQAPQRDWEAERKEAARIRSIQTIAAQSAARAVLAQAIDSHDVAALHFPDADDSWIDLVCADDQSEDHAFVAVQIRIARADAAANVADAERQFDAAAGDDADDGTDELVTDEAEG
ncbi:ParB/RepB/Spo0J family partition protein [Novosphingobium olei]|uniref:ParB/RepB/Spo0J family partition protein n=1 Tax=Novosphingobium olei TaxID=2728851 RepID=UPI003084E2CA|nr:ParB/RepB/Spo0J family partition protein [Novosphingobium olei]